MIYELKNNIREMSHKNKFIAQIYKIANIIKIRVLSKINDEEFAKLKYKENTGKVLDLRNPTTFNEKLWWVKIHNRDPLLTLCSDKVKVRDYVSEKGLSDILVPLFGVYDNANDIDFAEIPDKAYIKTNHGCGINIIWDSENPFNKQDFIKKFNSSLKENYYWQSREWNYKGIEPKIVVEKILENKNCDPLVDYRFLCFDGEVKIVFVDIDTAAADGSHSPYAKRNVYDKEFNYLDIKVSREQFDKNLIKKPKKFDKMIEYAEILSEPFVFSRVDLYYIDDEIYFGEITFYPGGCTQIVEPQEYEFEWGTWIDLESKKIVLGN